MMITLGHLFIFLALGGLALGCGAPPASRVCRLPLHPIAASSFDACETANSPNTLRLQLLRDIPEGNNCGPLAFSSCLESLAVDELCAEYLSCLGVGSFEPFCASQEETEQGKCTAYAINDAALFGSPYDEDYSLFFPSRMKAFRGTVEGNQGILAEWPYGVRLEPDDSNEHASLFKFFLPDWVDAEDIGYMQLMIYALVNSRTEQLWRIKVGNFSNGMKPSCFPSSVWRATGKWGLWITDVSSTDFIDSNRVMSVKITTPINNQPQPRSRDALVISTMALRVHWQETVMKFKDRVAVSLSSLESYISSVIV
ncbi:hypothetical protein QOT17_001344 [Balamuthia mandrillaris]